ncbi:hemoglobin [Onishia taeanensis]|uniref:Hemoglobin n=1 Tax=Onishia taeanensis TaxID=284577 RepID=A0A1G7ULY6_9GAMM|nr:group 1 truncated hemoglobin [Halomonas taeanensis]SDG48109.1 hemoglobin [Halomonas taeanensis]
MIHDFHTSSGSAARRHLSQTSDALSDASRASGIRLRARLAGACQDACRPALLIIGLAMLGGCAHSSPAPSAEPHQAGTSAAGSTAVPNAHSDSLYASLGGKAVIDAVVNDFLYRIAGDERIVGFFANTNIDHFAEAFATQLCDISDGPCDYTGPSMARAHQHMGITDAHFNAVVEHLRAALIDQGVPIGPRNRLLGRLARLRDAVMLRQP